MGTPKLLENWNDYSFKLKHVFYNLFETKGNLRRNYMPPIFHLV